MDRDYKDLENDDLAVYNFRGYTVLKFDKKDKQLTFGDDANACNFIPDDYKLMQEFLENCYKFCKGEADDVKDIEVN